MKKKRYEEAIEDCDQTIEIDESNVKAFVRRGTCKLETGLYEEAVRDFDAAHKLDPQSSGMRWHYPSPTISSGIITTLGFCVCRYSSTATKCKLGIEEIQAQRLLQDPRH